MGHFDPERHRAGPVCWVIVESGPGGEVDDRLSDAGLFGRIPHSEMLTGERLGAEPPELLIEEVDADTAPRCQSRVARPPERPVQGVDRFLHHPAVVVEADALGGVADVAERTRIVGEGTATDPPPPLRPAS